MFRFCCVYEAAYVKKPQKSDSSSNSEVFRLAMAPAVAFELHRHVTNFEFDLQHLMHVGKHTILIRAGRNYRMCGERELARGQAPYVKSVDLGRAMDGQ